MQFNISHIKVIYLQSSNKWGDFFFLILFLLIISWFIKLLFLVFEIIILGLWNYWLFLGLWENLMWRFSFARPEGSDVWLWCATTWARWTISRSAQSCPASRWLAGSLYSLLIQAISQGNPFRNWFFLKLILWKEVIVLTSCRQLFQTGILFFDNILVNSCSYNILANSCVTISLSPAV